MTRRSVLPVILLFPPVCLAQAVWQPIQVTEQTTVGIVSDMVVIPLGASMSFCQYPANGAPCTNKAATYTSSSALVQCSTSTQFALNGGNTCVANLDSQNQGGLWVLPGRYAYTVTINGITQGPYHVTVGPARSSVAVSLNATGNGSSRNVANRNVSSGGAQYISPDGNDANDGSSWASAKATIAAACAALPGGNSSCATGSGAIFIAPGFSGPVFSPASPTITLISYSSFSPAAAYSLFIGNNTSSPNQRLALDVEQGMNPTSTSSQLNSAISNELYTMSGNAQNFTGTQVGIGTSVSHFGSGTLSAGYGGLFEAQNPGPGAASTLVGVSGSCFNGGTTAGFPAQTVTNSGIVNACTGVLGRVTNVSSRELGSAFGVSGATVANTGGGTIGAVYGVYADVQTAGSTNYAFYSNGTTPSSLGGNLTLRGSGAGSVTHAVPSSITSYTETDPSAAPTVNNAIKRYTTGGAASFSSSPVTLTIASGTATMTTAAIASRACGATVAVAASGVATTDVISWSFNAAPAANPAVLVVSTWPTANNVNFQYCNATERSVTPNAATLNWRVAR